MAKDSAKSKFWTWATLALLVFGVGWRIEAGRWDLLGWGLLLGLVIFILLAVLSWIKSRPF